MDGKKIDMDVDVATLSAREFFLDEVLWPSKNSDLKALSFFHMVR
jgi:hypothetical protein